MSPLFGKKKSPNSTVAIIDIESGSIGSALVYLSPKQKPRLFAQQRKSLTPRTALSTDVLMREIERELEHSLVHINTVAARMRSQNAPGGGEIGRIAVFLHAPWVSVDVAGQKPATKAQDETLNKLRSTAEAFLQTVPVTFHAFSTTATPVVHGIFDAPQDALVCTIGGELTEMALLRGATVVGHTTLPIGLSTVLRTLESHAGLSRAEAASVLTLSRNTREHAWAEALTSATSHFTSEIAQGAKALLPESARLTPQSIFVIAPHANSDWFARMMTEDASLHELFAQGSTVRPVLARHASPHLMGHPRTPDVPLMLESLFVDTRFAA